MKRWWKEWWPVVGMAAGVLLLIAVNVLEAKVRDAKTRAEILDAAPSERCRRVAERFFAGMDEVAEYRDTAEKVIDEERACARDYHAVLHEGLARQLAWAQVQMKRGRTESARRSVAHVELALRKWAEANRESAGHLRKLSEE